MFMCVYMSLIVLVLSKRGTAIHDRSSKTFISMYMYMYNHVHKYTIAWGMPDVYSR